MTVANKRMAMNGIGSSVRSELDFYTTDPHSVELLMESEVGYLLKGPVWEPACGNGHISKELARHGYCVRSSDIVMRDYPCETLNFLECTESFNGDIVTNPPFKHAEEFVREALELAYPGRIVAFFMKLTFLEGVHRRKLFDRFPPKYVYVSSKRLSCCPGGRVDGPKLRAVAYAWFVWENGCRNETVVRWI